MRVSLRERLRPPRRLRVTREGKWFVALTLAVGAAAMNTGNNLLYLALSLCLSLVILSGFISERSLRAVGGGVAPASDLFARGEGFLAVRLDCTGKRGASRSLSVLLRTEDGEAMTVPFPDIPPGGSSTRVTAFRPSRRGVCRLAGGTLRTSYPFGLFEKWLDLPPPAPFLVYPRPAPVPAAGAGDSRRDGERRATARGPEGTGIAGVREHISGDALRDMHWKASARLGRWMVKERERDREEVLEIRVSTPLPEEVLEEELSRACGAVLSCRREGRPFLLAAGDAAVADDGGGRRTGEALSLLARIRADGTFEEDPLRTGTTP